jgi:DNA-binding transcriptional regulator YbjK
MASTKKRRALDAAIELVGTEGVRALTHRRVDAQAGLPDGSTSNYFRTRSALIRGVVDHMVSVELPELTEQAPPRSAQDLADTMVELFEFFTGPNRVMTSARLALIVEATHDEELRTALARGRVRFETVIRAQFAAIGCATPDLATQLMAVCFEGLFLHSVGGHAQIDARELINTVVRAAMDESGSGSPQPFSAFTAT